jgi:DNA-binding XRE family transcriptional regulator
MANVMQRTERKGVGRKRRAHRSQGIDATREEMLELRRLETGLRLKQLRMMYQIGQIEIAQTIAITPQRWNHYERGRRPIDVDVVCDLCDEYHVCADWLLRGVGTPLRKNMSQHAARVLGGEKKSVKLRKPA